MSNGTDIDTEQVRCSNCGRRRHKTQTAEAGTTVGNYLGLVGSFTTDVCTRCWSRIPEKQTQANDFGLLEFDGWERRVTANDSRFVSATWRSESHTITLDAVGDGEWTVSWFGENEASGETDDWHSRYVARQFAIDQIQRMVRLIKSDITPVSEGSESRCRVSEGTEDSPADSCDRCGSTKGTNWFVQAGTPAGNYLNLADGERTELCDECMQAVVDSIGGETDADNGSTKGGEYER